MPQSLKHESQTSRLSCEEDQVDQICVCDPTPRIGSTVTLGGDSDRPEDLTVRVVTGNYY